ncbi:hypothetical protein FMEAI12_3080036 [Parafrankia sp. Ea1.12]|nr:hypothetical protein FMEAI12_3080036 [Parafrankia sp. Ea1.12]
MMKLLSGGSGSGATDGGTLVACGAGVKLDATASLEQAEARPRTAVSASAAHAGTPDRRRRLDAARPAVRNA